MKKLIPLIMIVALLLAAVPVSAQGGPRSHQVESGDTWRSVASEYGVGVCRLVLANGHVRCSAGLSRRLLVGQTLRIPQRTR